MRNAHGSGANTTASPPPLFFATGKQKEAAYPSSSSPANGSEIPELERTLRLSLPLPAFAIDLASSSALTARIMPLYGSLEHAVILPSKKESSKKGSAMLVFPASNVSSAWALWDDCRTGQRGAFLEFSGLHP